MKKRGSMRDGLGLSLSLSGFRPVTSLVRGGDVVTDV